MTRVSTRWVATLATAALLAASPASAVLVNWDINPAQSSFTLSIPDQVATLGTITATMRLRNQNNATWTTNTAPVDGLLATDVGAGISSIQFLGGASSAFGVNTGNYRPNPAAFNTASTSTLNTAGSYTNTSAGPGVYAARVNATAVVLGFPTTLNVGYINFDNILYDASSAALAVTGTSFLANQLNVGILDSRANFDGISTGLAGQVVADAQGQTGPITALNANAAAGSIVDLGGGNYRLTVPISAPVTVALSGVNLNATASGQIVAYAFIPEPGTLVLLGTGISGLLLYGRRRKA